MDVCIASSPVNKRHRRIGSRSVFDCLCLGHTSTLEVYRWVVVVIEAGIGSCNSLDLFTEIAIGVEIVLVETAWSPRFVPECIEVLAFLGDCLRVNVRQRGELRSDSVVCVGGLARLLSCRKLILADHPLLDGEVRWDRENGTLKELGVLNVRQEEESTKGECYNSGSSSSRCSHI